MIKLATINNKIKFKDGKISVAFKTEDYTEVGTIPKDWIHVNPDNSGYLIIPIKRVEYDNEVKC